MGRIWTVVNFKSVNCMSKDKKNNKNDKDKHKKSIGEMMAGSIVPHDIVDEMRDSYLDYAMSVIMMRALPDVRDGMKPVHRRILFAAHNMNLTASAKFRKSAAIVGEVLGNYHPHGDASVYDALAKMAQSFTYRYPLIIGQGNFGSIDGDSPAAMRYTEAKMSKISGEGLKDIEKETVDWRSNYDDTKKEPVVLPVIFPNLLVNGTLGIAVGMATNIPPHNMKEVADAILHIIDNPKATTEDILKFVKGPDFPTGGVIFNKNDIKQAYATGRGGIVTRGHATIEEGSKGGFYINISSIPYRVNKADLIMKIAKLVKDKKLDGIKGLRDESAKDIRVIIELKNNAHPQTVLNAIYKHTSLEDTFHVNMVALVGDIPQILSLKAVLEQFILYRYEVIRRRTEFDLAKAKDREHILLGLKKALDHIDKIIKLIKSSKDAKAAHVNLIKEFKFSGRQATAILEMKLQKLAGLERKKIEEDLKATQVLIKELEAILKSPKKIRSIIADETKYLAEKYGDERLTAVSLTEAKSLSAEDLVSDEENVLVMTSGGYIKRMSPQEYRTQKRGGVGSMDMNTKEEDFVSTFLTGTTHCDILFFSDFGKVYKLKMYEIPEGRRSTKGKSIMNFLPLASDEKISSVLTMSKEIERNEKWSVIMVTKHGVVKKVKAEDFYEVRRSGLIAINLNSEDYLISSSFVSPEDTVVITTTKGQTIRFNSKDVRLMGRSAIGVKGINLRKKDIVISADIARNSYKDPVVLVLTEKGYGKKTSLSDYKVQKRGGVGIKTSSLSEKTGSLITARVVEEEKELIAISKKGNVIRMAIEEVPRLGRSTRGVRIMKLRKDDALATGICL